MSKSATPLLALALLAAAAIPGALHAREKATSAGPGIELDVHEFVLENGMRFLVLPRPAAPVFSGVIRFNVGGVDERPGITGMAHMFEHMAFKGTPVIGTRDYEAEKLLMDKISVAGRKLSEETAKGPGVDPEYLKNLRNVLGKLHEEQRKHIVKDEFDQIYSKGGAQGLNAGTGKDFTTYLVSLPKNRLEMWCLIESARLRWPVLREFYTERDVIAEERRFRIDTRPMGSAYETLLFTAFAAHPYRLPIVGWMSDIQTLKLEDAEAFYQTYYSPHNAVAALVGDLDPKETEALVRRYFGPIPRRGDPPTIATREPAQLGGRRAVVEFDAEPGFLAAWHKPTLPDRDDLVFEVIDALLTGGRTSRLHKRLVKEDRLAVNVFASAHIPGVRYDNLWLVSATPRHPATPEEVLAVIDEELDRLKEEAVEPRELQKILNQLEADVLRGLRSNMGMAMQLTQWQLAAGSWRSLLEHASRIRSVTPDEIRRVARAYLVPENRTVVTIAPKRPEAPEGGPER